MGCNINKMNIKILFILFFVSTGLPGQSQSSAILDTYISEGLKANLSLKQKKLSYERSIKEFNIARGAFFPDISINARYSVADGGRIIEFPVGDLLNPVYSTLHQLTGNLPPARQFPDRQVENQEFQFYRPTEHETKLHLVQPIFYPQIYYNRKIKEELALLGKINEQSYRRYLIAEIKTAYFNYLKTLRLEDILENSKDLVKENIRVNKSLFDNQKVTIDNVYKAEAELQKLEQKIAVASKNRNASQGYFNYLLNKPLKSEITVDSSFQVSEIPNHLDSAQQMAVANSKDIEALETSLAITDKTISLQKSSYLPTVSAVVDYGFQGETYQFTGDDDFVLASLILKWELFKGSQNRSKVQKALINKEIQQTKLEEAKKGIELNVINLFNDVDAVKKQMVAARKEHMANEKVFEVIRKKYNQGRANMLEFTDARTAVLNSGQQLTIARYDYYILLTELERTLGMFNETHLSR